MPLAMGGPVHLMSRDVQPGCPTLGASASPCEGAFGPRGCRVVDELSLLFDISYTLESSLELREVIRPVLLRMNNAMGLRRGTITILNRELGDVTIREAVGLPREVTRSRSNLRMRDIVLEPQSQKVQP